MPTNRILKSVLRPGLKESLRKEWQSPVKKISFWSDSGASRLFVVFELVHPNSPTQFLFVIDPGQANFFLQKLLPLMLLVIADRKCCKLVIAKSLCGLCPTYLVCFVNWWLPKTRLSFSWLMLYDWLLVYLHFPVFGLCKSHTPTF